MKNQLKEPITDKHIIRNMLPQKPPFVMVDELLSWSADGAQTGFQIKAENILVENGKLSEAGIVENMAQSIALQSAYGKQDSEEKAGIGVLAAIDSLKIEEMPKVGKKLITTITIDFSAMGMTKCSAETKTETGKLIAKAKLKTFIQS